MTQQSRIFPTADMSSNFHNKSTNLEIKWQAACIPRILFLSKVNTILSSAGRIMRLTSVFGFVQTAASFAKTGSHAKGQYVLVQCHSVATGYQVDFILDFDFDFFFLILVLRICRRVVERVSESPDFIISVHLLKLTLKNIVLLPRSTKFAPDSKTRPSLSPGIRWCRGRCSTASTRSSKL